VLPSEEEAAKQSVPEIPEHPGDGWYEETGQFWEAMWKSPMRDEFVLLDEQILRIVLHCVQDFYEAATPVERRAASKDIRGWVGEYGSTPMGRRRLQWEIAKTEEAQEKRQRRKRPDPKKDPRSQIKAVP
jgi:hypothetical protein